MSAQSRPLLGDGGEWIIKTIKRNPEGLLLLAAGAVLMLRTNGPRSSQASIDTAYNAPGDDTSSLTAKVAGTVSETARRATDAVGSYAAAASDTARQSLDAAKTYASSAAEYAGEARRKVGEQSDRVARQTRSMAQGVLQNQPLAVVVAGLAAGAALAATFPPTELEKETLGPAGDQVSKAAERVGDQLKQAATKAGEKLKSAAKERGLRTEGLKDVASEVAETFKASIRGQPEQANDGGPAPQPDSASSSG